jgi:hypothetical protein
VAQALRVRVAEALMSTNDELDNRPKGGGQFFDVLIVLVTMAGAVVLGSHDSAPRSGGSCATPGAGCERVVSANPSSTR